MTWPPERKWQWGCILRAWSLWAPTDGPSGVARIANLTLDKCTRCDKGAFEAVDSGLEQVWSLRWLGYE